MISTGFIQNLPPTVRHFATAASVLRVANNVYHLGLSARGNPGTLTVFSLGNGSNGNEQRTLYPVLAPLSKARDAQGHTRQFGSFTVKFPETASNEVIQCQTYLGGLVKALRAGACNGFPREIKNNRASKLLFHKLAECYGLIHQCAAEDLENGTNLLGGYRVEIVVKCTRYAHDFYM